MMIHTADNNLDTAIVIFYTASVTHILNSMLLGIYSNKCAKPANQPTCRKGHYISFESMCNVFSHHTTCNTELYFALESMSTLRQL